MKGADRQSHYQREWSLCGAFVILSPRYVGESAEPDIRTILGLLSS